MDNSSAKSYYQKAIEKIEREYGFAEYLYIQIRQSKHFMEKYYAEKIELDKIASAACMSRFHYLRIFQQVYGLTPRQYLKDLRINKAKQLLTAGTSIQKVCVEVGYDSVTTFSTVFKRGTGLTPKSYQLLNKSNRE